MKLGEVILLIIAVFTFALLVVNFTYMTKYLSPVTNTVVRTVVVTATPEPTASVSAKVAPVKKALPLVSIVPTVEK